MSRVLFEVSYIGCPRSFLIIVWVCAVWFFVSVGSIHDIKKAKRENSMCAGYGGVVLAGIVGFSLIVGVVVPYGRDILGYKWQGKYREVEGIVEDYTDTKNGYTFTIDGVEFEVSVAVLTWGYTYTGKRNVITENGQQLRIRYTSPTTILYIEEIGPPLTQPDMKQEEEIKEPAVPIDQIGIQGRTEEETDKPRSWYQSTMRI